MNIHIFSTNCDERAPPSPGRDPFETNYFEVGFFTLRPELSSAMSESEASERVVEILKKAYSDEMETVMNYQTNAIVLDGVRAEEIKESLQQDIQEELSHAQQLGQRLKQLDARPPGSAEFVARQDTLQPPEDSTNVISVIRGVLDAEEGAIETYRTLITAAEEADDPVTEDLAVTILADEEAHRTEFRGFEKEYQND